MKEMNLGQGTMSVEEQLRGDTQDAMRNEAAGTKTKHSEHGTKLFGTLEIVGDGNYTVFMIQRRLFKMTILTTQDVMILNQQEERQNTIVAVLKSYVTGKLEGWGKTYLLTRLMSNISTMVYMCSNHGVIESNFLLKGSYSSPDNSTMMNFEASKAGSTYMKLEMAYEGFKLNLSPFGGKIPVSTPKLLPVEDAKSKAAVVANLGVKTAVALFRSMGSRLDWFKSKNYKLISSNEEFRAMMLEFLRTVQRACDQSKAVLVGLDTETTGLHMYDLSKDNPLRDNVVAIPFAWEDNKAFVVCTDMYYFSNVDDEEVYPLLTKLFSRNADFSFQDIELDYCGEHFAFNRANMTVSGWNVMFDEMAFFSEDCDVFFDEDGRQLYFNLDTDLLQGQEGATKWGNPRISNSLKAQTRRMIGAETLELKDLFGPKHEDKYRYLQDETLAVLYGGADADFTRLCVRLGKQMTEPVLYKQYRKYDMTIMYQTAKAAWRGMPVNTAEVRRQGEMVKKDLDTIVEFIYHYAWLANRDSLDKKADRLKEVLDLDNDIEFSNDAGEDEAFRYPFTPANHKRLMFQMLGYPVIKYSERSGEPALDKFVLEKLMNYQRDVLVDVLQEDLVSCVDPNIKLVDKDQFNKDAYPLARVFSTYAVLNKEYTAYYKPIMENDMEGRIFFDFTMARAATRRILSPGQTMKGSLKSLVIAPPGKIFMSFDASQIEYRHMASLAYIRSKNLLQTNHPDDWERRLAETAVAKIHAMMQKEEADYHIETAASMTGVKQHEVTPKVRKKYKSIGFGIPYGLGLRLMCEQIHGGVVNDQTMAETKQLLEDYKAKQKDIIDLLESTRDSAFIPANISEMHRKYLGVGDSHVGIVRNFVGFYRVFILENLSRARTARIRRQAGNCIIQGGAAELFRRMLYNFHDGCCRAGIENKIQWLMTVHDELDALVDADIDIMLLIKVLYENCTLRYKDHIPYYIGINFGANWEDAKADANELPVIMVQRMVAAYDAGTFTIPGDGNQARNLLLLKRHYMCDRIYEELRTILPGLGKGHIWTDEEVALVDEKFENYVVRSYLEVFSSKKASLKERLEQWQVEREKYGFGVDFLQERLDIGQGDISELDLDSDFDLSLDLLENSSEEQAASAIEDTVWFDEVSLFDHSLSREEILVDSTDEKYKYKFDRGEEELLVENDKPTSAFDVYVTSRYIRTKVLKVQDNTYSVLLTGTSSFGKEVELRKAIKERFSTGPDNLVIIGQNVVTLKGVAGSEEDLDWLDKLLCGVH